MNRRSALAGMAAMAGLPLLPRAAHANGTRLTGRAFGTGWTVLAHGLDTPEDMAGRTAALLAEIDAEMSPFRADSPLSRFNAGVRDLVISDDMQTVVQAALDMARRSNGAFDPGIGPVVNRFGFGPIQGVFTPGAWQGIRCDNGLLAADASVTLDLCGIAKGHAVDRLAALFATESDRFIVEIGGEIRTAGDWPVGIADPITGGIHSRITLQGRAIATSGDAVNGFDHGGRRWSHVIDPMTGRPVAQGIASVSVIAGSAMEADALATALMVMGEERGLTFADAEGAAALFLIRDGEGLRASVNTAFAAHLI